MSLDCVGRRSKPRIQNSFPATVRGMNASGEVFETHTVLDNLSARGLYLSGMHQVEQGAKVSIIIQFSDSPTVNETRPRVDLSSEVLRVEREWSGTCCIARFLKAIAFSEA